MDFLKQLFASKRKKLYYIEVDDEEMNKEISQIIIQTSKKINEFKKFIDRTNITDKETILHELYELMVIMKLKLNRIESDVHTISNIKLNNERYFTIKDQKFFEDKKLQLEKISDAMDGFIQIVEQRPNTKSLKEELLSTLVDEVNHIMESTKYVIADDENLREIYKKISEI